MNCLAFTLLLLVLPVCACADAIYHVRPLSERELVKTYAVILRDACRHADSQWHLASFDPNAGYWGNGISDGNEGIRAVASMTLACGALLKYSDLKGAERDNTLAKARAGIRYAVSTHLTGLQRCTDGKRWGRGWQSAMWTATLAFGAWLIWADLDPELRQGVERVVSFEADRFLSAKPPSGRWADTKAEENAWDLGGISIAAHMLPDHPHAAAWREKAIEYAVNTLSVKKDRRDETLLDGRPIREWVCTENLHPDFTLENHNIFHPSYVQCSSYLLMQSAMHAAYARVPVMQASSHHLMDVWAMFQGILLPWGETAFPQGMDWELHGLPPINLFASLATWKQDPVAAEMERTNLQYIRAWQEMCQGDLAPAGSRLGFTRHAIQAEQVAFGYLAHKIFGPATDQPAAPQPSFVRRYGLVDVILHRTGSKLVSFSWKNRLMGMVMPIGAGHEGNPCFAVPIANGLIGSVKLGSGDAKVEVVQRSWKRTAAGFETTGVLRTNGGLLEQTLKMSSVGESAVVYQDRVVARSDILIVGEMGVPLGIENDEVTGGTRIIYHQDGKSIVDWHKPGKPFVLPGNWANVDGRLGVVAFAGSGMAYSQAPGYHPGTAVCADILYGSFSDQPRQAKAGGLVADRVVVVYSEISPEKTAALSKTVRVEGKPGGGRVLRFGLPEGGEARVPLL